MKKKQMTAEQLEVSGLEAALNTIKAKPFELFFAELFGKKERLDDGFEVIIVSRWRGKYFFLDRESKKAVS